MDHWERTPSHVLEAAEQLLTVQHQWMCLENIPRGEDIRRQLPHESMPNKLSEAIRGNLTQQQRLKIVVLVTIEVHARDILEKLVKSKVADASAFEWLSRLRMYWDREIDDCVVRQTNTQFQYGYEYLGNSGRLVITALTDRWVIAKC